MLAAYVICLNDLQDLPMKQKYLVTFTVGYDQKNNIDAAVKKVGKFSSRFLVLARRLGNQLI